MKLPRRRFLQLAASAAALPAVSRVAAQTYPARPVRVIVPFAPGGPTDVFARLMAQKLSEQMGVQFYVENIAGAGGNIGAGRAAQSAPASIASNSASSARARLTRLLMVPSGHPHRFAVSSQENPAIPTAISALASAGRQLRQGDAEHLMLYLRHLRRPRGDLLGEIVDRFERRRLRHSEWKRFRRIVQSQASMFVPGSNDAKFVQALSKVSCTRSSA